MAGRSVPSQSHSRMRREPLAVLTCKERPRPRLEGWAFALAAWFEMAPAPPPEREELGKPQSVIAIARSACRSRADSFSVSDFNWPHAARISRPRGVRTGEE